MSEQPAAALAVIVTGDDALVQRVCGDLRAAGHRVTIVPGSPVRKDVLLAAGIARAQAILALDDDDRVNLEVALEAREANPNVRVVLRQFNRGLAGKIEQNLPNCSVISLAANAAASIAAAAVEQSSFLGLDFPSGSRSLLSFARKSASDAGVAGMSVKDAEQHLGCRILSRGAANCERWSPSSNRGPAPNCCAVPARETSTCSPGTAHSTTRSTSAI